MPTKFHQNPRFWKILVNFYRNSTYRLSPKFSSNSILNLDKFLWGKLFLISRSFYQYFIWDFWSQLGLPFDQISLNYFKLIQINAKSYCSSGLGHPAFFAAHTRSRSPPRPLTDRPHLLMAPPPGTVPWPTCQWHRRPALCRCRVPSAGWGQGPRHPRAAWHPHARDPHLFPPLSPLPRCHRDARSLLARRLVLPSPLLSDPSSRALELPHRSSQPDRCLRPPAAPSPLRIPAEHHRRPPLPGELLPELPIPEISCESLTPSPLPRCRTSSPPPATTGAPTPPTNAAARRRWHRLTVDPPFRCTPALSSLPGTFPVTPSRSPATPCSR
jgi:hypothetical protein